MRCEVASWREDGWEPLSAFGRAMVNAYEASQAGAPSEVVARALRPLEARYGADVVTQAFCVMRAEMDAWRDSIRASRQ